MRARPVIVLFVLFVLVRACGSSETSRQVSNSSAPATSSIASRSTKAAPTDTPKPITAPTLTTPAAPTAAPLTAQVSKNSNVRDQPTTKGSNVLAVAQPGEVLTLRMRNAEGTWYGLETSSGVKGWVSASLLQIDPAIAAQVPAGSPAELAAALAAPPAPAEVAPAPADTSSLPPDAYPTRPNGLVSAQVVEVVDGDTLRIALYGREETLRMIGVDTPETKHPSKPVQCFGREASKVATELLQGKTIYLEEDRSQELHDQYGRILRYVWMEDGKLANLELIIGGYGHEYTYQTPYTYQAAFKKEYAAARDRGWGLWAATSCAGNTEQAADRPAPQPAPAAAAPAKPAPVKPAPATRGNCDPSYPDVCIPPSPPDLDCPEIPHRRFRVIGADPHRFDREKDGIGCERG